MSNTLAQNPAGINFNAVSQTRVFGSACTVNSLFVAGITAETVTTTATVTDSAGNTWTRDKQQAGTVPGSFDYASIHSAINGSSAAVTITATLSASGPGSIKTWEFTGNPASSPLDVAGSDGTTTGDVSIALTVAANSTIIGCMVGYPSPGANKDTGFTLDYGPTAGSSCYHTDERQTDCGAGGATTFTWGSYSGASHIAAVVASYKTGGGTLYTKSLTYTATSAAVLSRLWLLFRSLTYTATSAKTLTRTWSLFRTLAVTATSICTLTGLKFYPRTLSVTAISLATLTARIILYARSLSVTGTSAATLTRFWSLLRALTVTATSLPTLNRLWLLFRSLAVGATSVASLGQHIVIGRTLSATATSVATLTRFWSLLRSLTVTGTSVATLSRKWTLLRSLTVTATASATMSRFWLAIRSLTVGAVSAATIAALRVINSVTLSCTATSSAVMTRLWTMQRSLTVIATSAPVLTRVASFLRFLGLTSLSSAVLSNIVPTAVPTSYAKPLTVRKL